MLQPLVVFIVPRQRFVVAVWLFFSFVCFRLLIFAVDVSYAALTASSIFARFIVYEGRANASRSRLSGNMHFEDFIVLRSTASVLCYLFASPELVYPFAKDFSGFFQSTSLVEVLQLKNHRSTANREGALQAAQFVTMEKKDIGRGGIRTRTFPSYDSIIWLYMYEMCVRQPIDRVGNPGPWNTRHFAMWK